MATRRKGPRRRRPQTKQKGVARTRAGGKPERKRKAGARKRRRRVRVLPGPGRRWEYGFTLPPAGDLWQDEGAGD